VDEREVIMFLFLLLILPPITTGIFIYGMVRYYSRPIVIRVEVGRVETKEGRRLREGACTL